MEGFHLVLFLGIGLSFCGANPFDTLEGDGELKCGNSEVYNPCTNGGCTAKNCSQLGQPVPCIRLDPRFCQRGCLCMEGYLRSEKGECVEKEQCREAIQCSTNEVFSSCTNGGCNARNCSQLGTPVPCVKLAASSCIKGCVCAEGYLRARNGACVKTVECHKDRCPGPHEYYSCGGACDNVCAMLHEQSQKNCPIKNIRCNDMCYCEEGYARDAGGVCVPIVNCPQ